MADTEAQLETKIAELEAAKHAMLLAPLKGTVGDDTYDNTGRLKLIEDELARLRDELRARQLTGCAYGRRVV